MDRDSNLREQQKKETARKLLAVSLRLFVRRGFAGTTIRDIAKAARVSPALIFHHFDSKEAILKAHGRMVELGISSVVEMLRAARQPLETFRRIAELNLQSFEDEQAKYLFLLAHQILTLDSIPPAVKKMVSASRTIEESVPVIEAGQRRGEIRPGDAYAMAVTYWGALQGIAEVLVWSRNTAVPDAEHLVRILQA